MPKTKALGTTPAISQSNRLPVALESEAAILGAALRDSETAEVVGSELEESDFYSGANQAVFRAVKGLLDDSLTVNEVSVAERANRPRAAITELLEASAGVTSNQAKSIVSELRRIAELRKVYVACQATFNSIGKDSKLEEVVDGLEKQLYRSERGGTEEPRDGASVLDVVKSDFLRRAAEGGGPLISTGLADLDRALIGLRPGKMGVIAARPSMGKTALAASLRRSVVAQGYGVIEFDLEMSAEEVLERELAYQANLNLRKILAAKDVTKDELDRVAGTIGVSGRWFIDDRTYSIAGIRRKARILSGRMARCGIKTGLVIVDYLQLAGESGEHREQTIAAISRGTKLLAKELECTVLALSQLNRGCEYREDRRPLMSDLRESGAIEQDADWVGFVYREHMYDNSFPPEEAEFIIRKHRSGPTGTVHLHYNPKQVTFENRKQAELPLPAPEEQCPE